MNKRALAATANRIFRRFGFTVVSTAGGEFDMASMLQRLAGRDLGVRTIVDIGASDGKWSRTALSLFPGARVLAVEALEEQTSALERLAKARPEVRFAICAAGDVDGGHVDMAVEEGALDGATVGGSGGRTRSVPVRTISSLLQEHELPAPYLLKFDTHGFEVPILEGCAGILDQTACIIMEMYNFDITSGAERFAQMIARLEASGFRCCDLAEPMLRRHDQAFWQMDLAFVRSDHPLFAHASYQ